MARWKARICRRRAFEVAAFAGVVGGVEGVAEVAADDHHAEVKAESYACAEGYVVEEGGGFQRAAGAVGVVFEQPDVAGIEEECAMERTDDGETQLGVELELEGTCLVKVAVGLGFGGR